MRINKFVAAASGLSRRAADQAIADGRVRVNMSVPEPGQDVTAADTITLDGQALHALQQHRTIMFNKPAGYVVSRAGQGSRTIYDLLPAELHALKPVGRLDKDSSGLLILTSDGDLANRLTHPSQQKQKLYEVTLDKPLQDADRQAIGQGIPVENYVSRLGLAGADTSWTVTMHEGKNRQIRRTFAARGYAVKRLHRTRFGEYVLDRLRAGSFTDV